MSSHNLLPLLDQLQLMENSLTNFMFETILKLQCLTDSKVFLLLETSEKRRYCGSTELVDSFQQQGLTCDTADVQIELDSGANVLIEKPSRKRTVEISDVKNFTAESQNALGHKSSEASCAKKRKLQSNDGEDHQQQYEALEKAAQAYKDVPEYVISDGEEEDVGEEIDYEQWSPQRIIPYNQQSMPDDFSSNSVFFNALPDPHLERKKLDALLSIPNPWAAYEKGSMENKLMKSVLYSVGKNLALNCPYEELSIKDAQVQSYFLQQCDNFIGQCSALLVDKNQKPNYSRSSGEDDCLKGYSVAGFMRRCIRDGFKRVASSRKSKS